MKITLSACLLAAVIPLSTTAAAQSGAALEGSATAERFFSVFTPAFSNLADVLGPPDIALFGPGNPENIPLAVQILSEGGVFGGDYLEFAAMTASHTEEMVPPLGGDLYTFTRFSSGGEFEGFVQD
ncbi:MAG: hypothetical protein AAF414_15360 [Pseudomonadota bacterium]